MGTIILAIIGIIFTFIALVSIAYELFSDGVDFIADIYDFIWKWF